MAVTRYYPANADAPASPAALGLWDSESYITKSLQTTKAGAGQNEQRGADLVGNKECFRATSTALTAGKVVGGGNISGVLGFGEDNAGQDLTPRVHLTVRKADGSLRGVVIDKWVGAGEVAVVWNNTIAVSMPSSQVTVQAGDYLCLEAGFHSPVSTGGSGYFCYGSTGADAVAGDSPVDKATWIDIPINDPVVVTRTAAPLVAINIL